MWTYATCLSPIIDEMIESMKHGVPWLIINQLHDRMAAIMSEWRAEDFDSVVSEHRAAFHSNLSLG